MSVKFFRSSFLSASDLDNPVLYILGAFGGYRAPVGIQEMSQHRPLRTLHLVRDEERSVRSACRGRL